MVSHNTGTEEFRAQEGVWSENREGMKGVSVIDTGIHVEGTELFTIMDSEGGEKTNIILSQ
jgi:hypothetical protein